MAKIIITGSSRGIGFELVRQLADQGHHILALSRNDKPVRGLQLERVAALPMDLCEEPSCQAAAEWVQKQWGQADILIHNAGMLVNKAFSETRPEDFDLVYRVNVLGLAELTRQVLPHFSPEGHVVVITSMGGIQGSAKFPGLAAYSSSKGAVITLTELLAEEYNETGPAFNALALGAVQTEMLEAAFPGYQAPISAADMAAYIGDFALNGQKYFNGKVLQVSSSTP
jgi:NAD(P)-dependent dehydrogenase (short-subunit alcohol dehydrogenase family)